ncbi:hypothetical protein BABINDRAFT_61500 [Babjeviella inositovora NRRL Y-12698]|uniref:RNA polymerase II-associated protein RBA50 n=1 Tax=Babjeviella inositovora NRRL Y-12698 TaxID=984486 RepID=A0A1E3QRF9_9ASCO|nr:uncharacterized protein BABINDRAFT_61500 [Babjeviella inositovora NRRL Y-12698]ODQ80296.1 hypothetical protein BABINDRAFT_61500 [Babjeviella inositovora NRRL Y-12698]
MDLIGDIVEHDIPAPVEPSFPTGPMPDMSKRKPSAWRKRFEQKGIASMSGFKKMDYLGLSEAEKINQENIEVLSQMSAEEREREKQELIDSLDPMILQALIKRANKRSSEAEAEIEGYGTWIGGTKEDDKRGKNSDEAAWGGGLNSADVDKALGLGGASLVKDLKENVEAASSKTSLEDKKVRFNTTAKVQYDDEDDLVDAEGWEDVEYLDDLAPSFEAAQALDNQTLEEMMNSVHFPRRQVADPTENKLDLDDPDFNRKLHEKYFPDLPMDTEKLKWMEPVKVTANALVYDNINELRFDFRGDLIIPDENAAIPTHAGLHHHSEDAQMAGYTFRELAHLARSKMNSQRCIAIQTLGRILHKLGKKAYNIVPESAGADAPEQELSWAEFEKMCREVIAELRITETLEAAADEKLTKNLSVRNYAIEALWLWKQGESN